MADNGYKVKIQKRKVKIKRPSTMMSSFSRTKGTWTNGDDISKHALLCRKGVTSQVAQRRPSSGKMSCKRAQEDKTRLLEKVSQGSVLLMCF